MTPALLPSVSATPALIALAGIAIGALIVGAVWGVARFALGCLLLEDR